MIAYCGLDCSRCEGFLATQEDDDNKRAEVAKRFSVLFKIDIRPEQINCDGCRSDGRKIFYCSDICEIRKCCTGKQLTTCAACDLYACDKLEKFFEIAPEARRALDALCS